MKAPFISYADFESSLEKMSTCHNNPKELSTTKINKYTPSGYSLFTHCSFDFTNNKLDCYRGKDCMKKVCKDSIVHATKITKYEQKEMIPLTYKENLIKSLIKIKKFVIYAKKNLLPMMTINNNIK